MAPDLGSYEVVRVPVRTRMLLLDADAERQVSGDGLRALGRITRRLTRKSVNAGHRIRASMGGLDPVSDWPNAALLAGDRLLKRRRIDALWATAGPSASLWAADRLGDRYGLPWVADIRDALELSWRLENYKELVVLARSRRIVRRASAVVEVTPEHAARDARWLRRPCQTITSGFDPGQWQDVTPIAGRSDGSNLEIVYAGRLWPGYRTLGPAFAGLSRLREREPGAAVRIVYYGRSDELVRRDARRYGVEDITECRGFVSPDELRAHLASADVLLLPTNQAGQSGVPGGKFYEYLAARRPILAVPGEDRFVTGVLHETGAGVGATSPEQVSAVLGRWLEEWSRTGEIAYTGREDAVNRYSIRESARRLATLLDAAADDHAPARRAAQTRRASDATATV
jgi:glycosyltransferase involved in cell wall biosynthesis